MRIYAIGDIHGHLDKLRGVHDLIAADRARVGDTTAKVVHVGDLVDRGPDSRGVIDYLIRMTREDARMIVLKGNHDRFMHLFLMNPMQLCSRRPDLEWVGNPRVGGADTLASYGVDVSADRPLSDIHTEARAKVPAAHADFLRTLPLTYQTERQFFCHAGIRPGVSFDQQAEDDLLWIREEFHDDPRDHGALVVHGHTPVDAVTHYGNRLNLDTGAGYGRPISAVVIEEADVWLLTPDGRVPVRRV